MATLGMYWFDNPLHEVKQSYLVSQIFSSPFAGLFQCNLVLSLTLTMYYVAAEYLQVLT